MFDFQDGDAMSNDVTVTEPEPERHYQARPFQGLPPAHSVAESIHLALWQIARERTK